jgi:hypothetical protein
LSSDPSSPVAGEVIADPSVRLGHSRAARAADAARDFHAQVRQDDMALVVFFCSNAYDRDDLAAELNLLFGDTPVVGCTTAGEIGPAGYCDHSISGASFASADFAVAVGRLDDLQGFDTSRGCLLAQDLLIEIGSSATDAARPGDDMFAMLLIDGLSVREEHVTRSIHAILRDVPLVGGSAGDGLEFGRTWVFHDRAFHTDSAVVVLVRTPLPFHAFKTQHFVPTDDRVVVTKADADTRVVYEIDGRQATATYAQVTGGPFEGLHAMRFASSPMVVQIDGTNFVRSIQKANPDGSLTFFAAVEEGLVLRVARGVDLVDNLDRAISVASNRVGGVQGVIAFDCVLRRLEVLNNGLIEGMDRVVAGQHVVGFSSYGEQFGGVHINQTLTGIAIGGRQ